MKRTWFLAVAAILAIIVAISVVGGLALGRGLFGQRQHAGEVADTSRPAEDTQQRIRNQDRALARVGADPAKQIRSATSTCTPLSRAMPFW